LNQIDKKNTRRFFWFLMGAMMFVTAGVVSLALNKAEEAPEVPEIKNNFSLRRFFPSLKVKMALAQGTFLRERTADVPFIVQDSDLLPQKPEFERGGLFFEEVLPDEAPVDGFQSDSLVPIDFPPSFDEPLPIRNPLKTLSLSDVSRQKADELTVIERLAGEDSEASGEDPDERPWVEHTVGQGELMNAISRKYGIPIADICRANGIKNANRLALGQVLLIPRSVDLVDDVLEELKSRAAAKAAARQVANPVSYTEYSVKNGDSLWQIATAYKLSIDTLYSANAMRNPDKLKPGMLLRIPNQDGLIVKITKGQTIAGLAKKYDVSEKAIRMANHLEGNKNLVIGEEIFLPGASQSVSVYRGSAGSGGVTRNAPQVANNARDAASKRFSWPVSGRISSPFGWRTHPIKKARIFHTGLDIRAPRNTPIRAAQSGQVVFAGWMSGYGRSVIIRHDRVYTTLYAHAQTLKVKKGMYVKKGTVIAAVGSSGRATGPHVHFEVRRNGKPANPIRYLR
jgi:murein DD-endopeptidase MepM/ murein hydrolase activator NlpD